MLSAPIPENDAARLASLRDMTLLSTPREADLDRLTRITKLLAPKLRRYVDHKERVVQVSNWTDITGTPREFSFYAHAIRATKHLSSVMPLRTADFMIIRW
jgi:hypothetical protein